MRARIVRFASVLLALVACSADDPAASPASPSASSPAPDGGAPPDSGSPSGTAPLVIAPAALSFPLTGFGATSAVQVITITNNGDGVGALLSPAITGANSASFAMTRDGCLGRTLLPAESCSIDVVFRPATTGLQLGALNAGALKADFTGTGSLFTLETTSDGVANGLRSVFVQGSNQVYAVGDDGRVIVSNGTTWTAQATPAGSNQLRAVYGSKYGYIYVGGAGPTLLVKAPTTTGFSTVTLPSGATAINALWATPPGAQQSNVLAMGEGGKWVTFDQGATPTLLKTYSATTAVNAMAGHHDASGGGSYAVCAAGANDTTAYLASSAGTDFMAPNMLLPTGRVLTGAWTDGSTYVMVGFDGAFGAISRGTGTCGALTTEYTQGPALAAIWGVAPNDLWAVGAGGTVLHSNAAGVWQQVESGTTKDLRAIHGTDSSNFYIVGDGVILHKKK